VKQVLETRNRLDKWLWFARFYKTRALAMQAVTGGKVKINGERVKPAHNLAVGDRLSLSLPDDAMDLEVLTYPARRGPAAEAQACYAETAASQARRAANREQRRLADLISPRPESKPDKRDRRRMEKFRRSFD
jgi:ribosome-associated heat shock protein Hsp15